MKIARLLVAAMMLVVCGFSQATFAAEAVAEDLQFAKLDQMLKDYDAAKTPKERVAVLEGFLKVKSVESHVAFYTYMATSETADIPLFKAAVKSSGTVEMFLNIGSYIRLVKKTFQDEAGKKPDATEEELNAIRKKASEMFSLIMLRFESLGPELEVIARKNPKMLVEAVEKCFAKEGDMLEAFGPMVGLLAMREAGATILLKALDGDGKGKGAVVMASKSFGANMVMPALKQYEDPNSTEKERNTAGLAILTFADVEPVYDKVVEACKHGRYFAIPGAKKDKDGKTVVAIEDITAGVKSWWWNQVNFHYRNNTEFVEYVARKYLSEADGQDKVIQLLIDVNFGKAAPFLMKLDFNKLSDASLDVMRYATHILPSNAMLSSIIGKEKDYAAEKFLLYAAVFKAVDPKKREAKSILFSLFTFPPEYIPRFVEANVGSFTEKEKESCAFKCGYMSPDIPKETRKKVLGLLRKGASKELLGTIEYVEKGLD